MSLVTISYSWITGMTLGAQWHSNPVAEDYYYYSYLILDLFILSLVFEFEKPVTD
jgi:hypothetical protein